MKLSILMPVYNEAATIELAVKRVLDVPYPCDLEFVIVDDGSRDGTADLLARVAGDPRVTVVSHATNRGKGAAIRTALDTATGDYLVICDADLEYSPEEIPDLVAPVLAGDAAVVYGTRTFGSHSSFSFWYVMGNRLVTLFANVLYNCYISDLETCFKLMPVELYRRLGVRSAGFGMEAEVTSKLLKLGMRPFEVPVSYHARGREEGKKITWRDGVAALWIIARIRFGWRTAAASA
ncbi:glycosyltransferase family 2 protein [Luedemannella flava]|uniref:Glycosyltransferase family 2 protein n=1 Tax=Luedemannella flava TaxID=349316 RepID=A0ABN2MGS9_9ACTN